MIWVMKATLYFRGHGSSLDITDTPTINKIIVRPRKKTFPAVPTLHYFVHLKKKNYVPDFCKSLFAISLVSAMIFSRCIFLVLVCLSEKIPECLRATWRIVGIWGISDASNRMRLHFGAHTHTAPTLYYPRDLTTDAEKALFWEPIPLLFYLFDICERSTSVKSINSISVELLNLEAL